MNWILAGDLEDLLNCVNGVNVCLAHFLVPMCVFTVCAFGPPLSVCSALITDKQNGGIITDPPSLPFFLSLPLWWQHCMLKCTASWLSAHCVPINKALYYPTTDCPTPSSSPSSPPVVTSTKRWHVPGEAKCCCCLHEETVVGLSYKTAKGGDDEDGGSLFLFKKFWKKWFQAEFRFSSSTVRQQDH